MIFLLLKDDSIFKKKWIPRLLANFSKNFDFPNLTHKKDLILVHRQIRSTPNFLRSRLFATLCKNITLQIRYHIKFQTLDYPNNSTAWDVWLWHCIRMLTSNFSLDVQMNERCVWKLERFTWCIWSSSRVPVRKVRNPSFPVFILNYLIRYLSNFILVSKYYIFIYFCKYNVDSYSWFSLVCRQVSLHTRLEISVLFVLRVVIAWRKKEFLQGNSFFSVSTIVQVG